MCSVTSVISDSVIPWTVAHQTPLSMGFSRQEYWSGLPCLPPGNLPNLGIESKSPVSPILQVDSLLLSHQGSPVHCTQSLQYKRRKDGLQTRRGWQDLVTIALNVILGTWGFLLQAKQKQGTLMIRPAFGEITPGNKKDRLMMGRDGRWRDQLGSYCSCGGGK